MVESNIEIAEMVVRRSTRYQQMSEEERRAVDNQFADFINAEDHGEELDIPAFDAEEDDGDLPFLPNLSAVDYDSESEVDIEINEEVYDDDDDDYEEETPTSESYFIAKDGTQWSKNAPPTSRIRAHNVVNYTRRKPGPIGTTYDPFTIFCSLFTEDMTYIIIRESNRKGREITDAYNLANPTNKKEFKTITLKECDAFLAILLYSGLNKSNNEPSEQLWAPTRCPIYKAALSYNRFMSIKQCLRFDNGNTRKQRLINSKTVAIDNIWQMLQSNLAAAYTPHDSLTVDEQLFPYRGRTRFTQYIPSKPAKYGIKVWWLCDSKSFYPVKGMIYSGKLPDQEREINQGQNVVLAFADKYLDSGRTIYADNFFSTLNLARILMRKKTAYVGTVRSNKTFVPRELHKNRTRPINGTLFGFNEGDIALCSYVPRKNKSVILLSTQHYTYDVNMETEKKKPLSILDYNANKSGVDTMNQMLGTYTCKRSTKRWPLAMFYNMVDIAAVAAFIIFNEMKPVKRSDRRRSFLLMLMLTKQLALPNIEERALNTRITAYPRIRNAMEEFDVKIVPRPTEAAAPSFALRTNRPSCRLCRSEYGRQRKTRAYCCSWQQCTLCKAFKINASVLNLHSK